MCARGRKKSVCANNIRLDEETRAVDRTVDMGFRRQMDHRVGQKPRKHTLRRFGIGDIGLQEIVIWMGQYLLQIVEIRRVSELVQIEHGMIAPSKTMAHDSRTDKARPSGY